MVLLGKNWFESAQNGSYTQKSAFFFLVNIKKIIINSIFLIILSGEQKVAEETAVQGVRCVRASG